MSPGDVFIGYTDGVTEAQNMGEEFYEDSRLLEVSRANLKHPAGEILNTLLVDIQSFVGEAPQFDDLTLMVVSKL